MSNLRITTPTDREILITREFNAPRQLVWDAFTQPEFLKRWFFGPPGWSLVVCEVALEVGAKYRYVWRHDNGNEMGISGVCLEIVPPERMVSTEKFDQAWYEGEAVGTILLTEQDGRTTLLQTIRYESREVRDGVLRSPMEQGLAAGYDRLAELVEAA